MQDFSELNDANPTPIISYLNIAPQKSPVV